MSTTTTYLVDGMTCGHCVSSVTSELMASRSIRAVNVDLHPGGISAIAITSDRALDRAAVATAIHEAGFALVDAASTSDPELSS